MRMKNIKYVLIIALFTVFTSLIYAQSTTESTSAISWSAILFPGRPPVDNAEDIELEDSDSMPNPLAEASIVSMTSEERSAYTEHEYQVMSKRYPPVLGLQITFTRETHEADKVVLEANLSYSSGISPTYCLQLIPLNSRTADVAEFSTVYEATSDMDISHAITATPDPDGVFRFNITGLIEPIGDGDISNRFMLKPFQYRDKFEIPDYGSHPFTLVMMSE